MVAVQVVVALVAVAFLEVLVVAVSPVVVPVEVGKPSDSAE